MNVDTRQPLSLKIALDTLRHLGINLYSSLPPVLSELVANAYDGRARRVDITLGNGEVMIQDDGIGMDREDMQNKYLVVGRDRRLEDPPLGEEDPFSAWPRRDKPMGRKGIGKLAMFSIANEVEIVSNKGGRSVALKMDRQEIEEAARANKEYHPAELEPSSEITGGTLITLRKLRRERAISPEQVLKSIARRFSVISTDDTNSETFTVFVNGIQVSIEHWDIFSRLQCIWILGPDSRHYLNKCRPDCRQFTVEAVVSVPGHGLQSVSGWLGTVARPEQLKSKAGDTEINDNRIVIDCRGKVSIANFLHQFGESGVYASYLTGYIRADYLDDSQEDIATSDRERMREDDPRVVALRGFVWQILKRIQREWTEVRRETALSEAEKDSAIGPVIADWLAELNDDERADAKRLIGRLGSARFAEDSDKAQVLKYGILAFERLRVRHRIHLLRNAPDEQLATIAAMFALESDLENALYADIASQRLEVVKKLENLVDSDAKERIVQQHIFDHLWLLEPSWTIQDQLSSRLEQRVTTEFQNVTLPKKERDGRIDIRYRRSGGIHIIVELKKPDVKRSVYELVEQVERYRSVLGECLRQVESERNPNIQCVCLLGILPPLGETQERVLAAAGVKLFTYDQVISDSCKRFAEYLEAQRKYGRLQSLLARLDTVEPFGP